ncbi:MAG: hypothetical protein ACP5VE_14310 [Chthonomonadales bacterium]
MKLAHTIQTMLDEVLGETTRWAKPFDVIEAEVRKEIASFAHEAPDRLNPQNLFKQLALVQSYVDKGLLIQAILPAREWVVSYVLLCRGSGDWLRHADRKEAARALGAAAARVRGEDAEVPNWFARLSRADELAQLWNRLVHLRSDLAHCAMIANAPKAQSIEQDAKTIPQELRVLLASAPDVELSGGRVVIDLSSFYESTARLDELPAYVEQARALAGEGNEVILTGQAPVWLYLAVAQALHGKARRLLYASPVTGEVCVFDHSPW